MSQEPICRGALPPPPGSKMMVVRITSPNPATFVCISSKPWGQWVHWSGRRSSECTEGKSKCSGCAEGWNRRWKGYLQVTADDGRSQSYLEITSTCFQLFLEQMGDAESWRGLIFRIKKTAGGAKGRFIVELLERRADTKILPPEKDPMHLLQDLWNAKRNNGQKT